MSDRIGQALGQIIANNARKERGTVTRTPRTGSGRTLPPPPVLSPIVHRAANVGSVARQAAATPGIIPPPPILTMPASLGQRAADALPSAPTTSLGLATTPTRMPSIASTAGSLAVRTTREGRGQEWGVYSVDGVNVAMPSVLARHNGFSVPEGVHEPTSDPELVENLRSSSISYDKMPDEVASKIRMPSQISLGSNLSEQAKQVKQEAEVAALPEKAQMLTDFATSATTSAMEDAATIMSPEWQAEHEFALVMHRENGTTHLIPRKELRSATDPETGQFNVVTNSVSRDEAASMVAAGAIDPDTRMTVPTGTDSLTVSMQRERAEADAIARNQQIAALRDQGVVEIDGRYYPAGTTEPIKYPEWHEGFEFERGNIIDAASSGTRFVWARLTGDHELVVEDLPANPTGWVWVTDGDDVWLVEEQYDVGGNAVVPRGAEIVRTENEATDTIVTRLVDTGSELFINTLETVVGGAIEHGHKLLPAPLRDGYNKHIKPTLEGWIVEHVPEGRFRNALLAYIENPIAGVVLMASAPGDYNVELITKSIIYPDDNSRMTRVGGWQRELPFVNQYVEYIEANPDKARDAFENGYESEGEVLTGVEATMQLWHDEELADSPGGSFTWLMFLMVTDPLTYAAGAGVAGRGIRSGGRSIRMRPGAGPRTQAAGRVVEGVGRAVEVGARIAEDAGDLGSRYALNLVGRIGSRINPMTSSALGREAEASARSTIADLYGQNTSGNTAGLGTLEPDRETGNIVLRLAEENIPTTGPLAQSAGEQVGVDLVEMNRIYDEAYGIEPGDTVQVGRGAVATRTADGWEVTTQLGDTARAATRAGAVEASQNTPVREAGGIPERYVQRTARPGEEPSYIDQMPRQLYESTIDEIGTATLAESVVTQRRSSETEVPTIRNLNETDRMGWLIKETAESIDPTFRRQWERNWNGGDTLYQLSEAFRRSDLATALQYWEAMTGQGTTVPLVTGQLYRGSSPVITLESPRRSATSASNISVQRANAAVDNIFARLKYHPGDVYDPRFADIVRRAALLDYQLRQRGLRSSGPDWMFNPITSLIPDDAPIQLSKAVRAMAEYEAPAVRVDDAGEFIGRITLHRESGLGVDVYRVPTEQVPGEWLDYWSAQMPEAVDQPYWAQGIVERSPDESFTVFAPDTEAAVRLADETALARGWTDFDQPDRAIDHVEAVEPQAAPQEAIGSTRSGDSPQPDSLPASDSINVPEAINSSVIARMRQLLDEVEGVEAIGTVEPEAVSSTPTRSVTEIIEAEQTHTTRRMDAEAWAAWGQQGQTEGVVLPKRPQPTGEVVMDPSGTIEMPRYERVVADDTTPPTSASKPGQKILDDVMALPDNSPALRAKQVRAGKPTPATHTASRSGTSITSKSEGYWLNRTIEDYQVQALTEYPFPDGETLMDRITRYTVEAGDAEQWRRAYDPDVYIDQAIAKAWPEYEAHLYENHFKRGVFNDEVKARIESFPKPIRWALEKAAVALRGPLKAYDFLARYYRERILFNWLKVWHYPAVQYFGNMFLAALSGDLRVMAYMANPANVKRAYAAVKAGSPEQWWKETGIPTRTQVMHSRLGTTPADETRDVLRGRAYGQEGDKFIGQKTLERTPGGRFTSRLLGSRFARDFGAAMDVVYREALEYSTTVRNLREMYPDYRNQQINRLIDWLDIDANTASRMWKEFEDVRGSRWEFSHDDVVRHFSPTVGRGRAERMGRDWKQTLNQSQKITRGVIRHRAMAQGQTRADLVAQRLLAFHYFQSRQWWFMVNQMVKHPFLINIYFSAVDELERIAEDNNWPPYLKGWVRLMSGPGGRDLFWNPFALLSTYNIFDQENTFRYDQEDEHRNQVEKWIYEWTGFDFDLQNLGLNPVIDKTINVTGLAGDTWAPDLLHLGRESSIVTLAINTGRAWGLIGDDPRPIGDVNTDANSMIREGVSSALNHLFPGVFQPVESRSSEQSMDREIRAIMADELAKQGIDPESDEGLTILAQAEMDPDSDLYQKSLKRWIYGEWYEQGARIVAGPFRPRTRIMDHEGNDLMTSLGGRVRTAVNTPEPMVTMFRVQSGNYYELGDMRANKGASIWSEIANGEVKGDITVNGVTYTEGEINNNMTREQRTAIANGYMAEIGLLDDIHTLWDERDKFLAQPENREFAQFDQWRTAVYGYEGGPEQYWEDLIRDNPLAEAYYNTYIRDEQYPNARRRMMTGQNAFFAIKGWDTYVFDKPTEAYMSSGEIWDPVGIANTQAQPTPYQERNAEFNDAVRQLPVFQSEMEAYDRAFRDKMEQRGYNRNMSVAALPSRVRRDIEDELADEGKKEPSPSWQIERYLEWVEQQPPGADVSIEAFLEANQAEYYSRLPGQTEEAVRTPPPLPSPDTYGNTPTSNSGDFWESIYWLLNEHDHNRYNDPWSRP